MRLLAMFAVILAIALSLAQAQDYNNLFPGFGSFPRAPIMQQQLQATRDPRTNTGPVLFPPGPPGNPADTSGVIVGASGYGFVPPHAGLGKTIILPTKRPYVPVIPPSVKILKSPYHSLYYPAFFRYLY